MFQPHNSPQFHFLFTIINLSMHSRRRSANNPEFIDSIIPYATYHTYKIERKQTQTQRQQVQHTTSFLERQAKKSVKELQAKQQSLINFYKLKESRFQQMRMKEQHRKKMERELEEHKRANTFFRESNTQRRRTVRNQWQNSNKSMAKDVKSNRSQSQRKLSQERQLQSSLLKKRNQAFSRAMALGNQHSRIRSFYSKRFISSQVKNDLITVQENIKHRQLEKINDLNERQQQLLEIVQRTKKEHNNYDHTLTEVRSLPFEQMYPKIKSVRSKKSRRSSSRSDSLLI